MSTPRRRRRWPWALLAVTVAVVGAGLVLVRVAGQSDPVTIADVLREFRAQPSTEASGAPAAGVYTYAVTGRESGGIGPLKVSRTLPRTATMALRRTGRGWETQTDYSRQHIEGARLVIDGDAVSMVWRRVDVRFGLGRDDRRDLRGRYRIAPLSPRVGERFRDVYFAGTLRNTVLTRVLRRQTVVVGATPVPTVVIASSTTTDGALSGTREETLWWSPELRVPVRSRLHVTIGGAFGFESDIDMRLTGLRPLT